MNTQLAIPKKAYSVKVDGEIRVLLCDEDIPRKDHMKDKAIVKIDGKFINCAYVSFVEEITASDDIANTAIARAKKQIGAISVVALERIRSYEARNGKMPIDSIMRWTEGFLKNGKTEGYKRFYDLYIKSGGNINNIGPFDL